ncbi:MAG: hypothetical protein K2R98_21840 [Gemmataceae bacterium]|nr:hypothetical protein [Gemmataceae bacterium]
MRMFIMWHPPEGWVEEVESLQVAQQIIARQYPLAAYSTWCPVFPSCPEGRMFVWKDYQAGQGGEPVIAWVISVS